MPRRSNAHVEQDEGDEDHQNPRSQGNCRETVKTEWIQKELDDNDRIDGYRLLRHVVAATECIIIENSQLKYRDKGYQDRR